MKALLQNKSNWLFLNAAGLILVGILAELLLGWSGFVGPIFIGLAIGILIGAFMVKAKGG